MAYGLWFSMPLTHIYTLLIPLFIAIGVAMEPAMERSPGIALALILIVGLAATSFNVQAFVDVSPEYPWNSKTYIFGKMPDALSKGEPVEGVFGFPYNRDWWRIRAEVAGLGVSTYASNEKLRLTRYYLREFTWDETDYQIYIWVDHPQSLSRERRPAGTPLLAGTSYAIFGR
jgi:hypothetical protein